ncbi:uncharacterized protein LOC144866283 [Branchiostoma floridae x Branchiostoma japonicum]
MASSSQKDMEKTCTNPRLSAVAEEFQELDLLFAIGSDLDVVEKGYARQLIHAISTENKVLKCEALKSLGDLYLHKAKAKEQKARNFHKACAIENRLKTESLKSLGDLYLEKGRVGRDEAAFTTAAGLYRAALDRYEDSDGRETLKHRVKYAEKVKEKAEKTRQETRQPGSRKAGNDERTVPLPTSGQTAEVDTDSTYQDHLQEGCRAQGTGDLDRAEEHFAAALKSVHVEGSNTDQHSKETEPLYKLSDVYLKRGIQSRDGGDFTKAAALCNAALVRAREEDRDSIEQTIQKITRSFIKHVLSQEQTVDIGDAEKHKLMLKEDRDFVESDIKRVEQQADPYSLDDDDPKIREVEEKRAESIKALCQAIVDQRRSFIAGLVDECTEVMGPPPCKYAMIGLGSQATGLVTPYSDLEFAILIERETEDNVGYFRNLTHYLHLKVINLGETILPAMGIKSLNDFSSEDPLDNWFYDSVTPRGFAFDGAMPHACKTPLGRGKTAELIHTPSEMTKVLTNDLKFHLKKGYHLASILRNVCLITGGQDLVDTYADLWTLVLQRSHGLINLFEAQDIFLENKEMIFQPITSTLVNVKKEIYRFSTFAVYCWALFSNIQPTTIWDTIEKMHKNGVISSENAHHLMVLVSISAELRLRTYMNNRGQVENMSALSSMSTDMEIDEALKKVFYFSNPKQLMRYYNTARPLKRQIAINIKPQGMSSVLFDNSPELQMYVYDTLCDYKRSKTCIKEAIQEAQQEYGKGVAHPKIGDLLHKLASTCQFLGDFKTAVTYHEQSLEMRQSVYGENIAHPDICESLNGLGGALIHSGDPVKAKKYFEQALKMQQSIHGEDTKHPDIADTLQTLGAAWRELGTAWSRFGDHRKAVGCYEQALQMRQDIHGENTAHPEIADSLNILGVAWCQLGDPKKAFSYHEQALQMRMDLYRDNPEHPAIIESINNWKVAWRLDM